MASILLAQIAADAAVEARTFTVPATLGYVAAGVVVLAVLLLVVRVEVLRRRCLRLEQLAAERSAEVDEARKLVEEQKQQLSSSMRTDPLTGIGTRKALAEDLPSRIGLARRAAIADWPDHFCPRSGMALFKIGLDHFAEVGSSYGQKTSDALLAAVATALRELVRTEDLLVRSGEAELVVVASGISHEGIGPLAEKLMRAVAGARVTAESGREITVTASIGLCPYPLIKRDNIMAESWNHLLNLADKYLERARSRGGNRACGLNWHATYSPEHGEIGVLARLLATPDAKIEGLELVEIKPRP